MLNNHAKARMLCAVAASAFTTAWAAPSVAQTTASRSADEGDAIIVTARRVEEDIQDVPISITVFNQKQLSDKNVSSATDLATYTPNLTANQKFGADNTTFSVRGFFQELRTTASVGVYFADVVAPRGPSSTAAGDGAGPGDFFDLQNVQVLKGPQGTLFGRNTTGGAVLLVPQKPGADLGGYVEGTVGNYDQLRLQGVLNLPISENIRLRIGADRQTRDGYQKNITDIGPRRFGNTDYVAARASLVVDVTPDLENYTIATYAKSTGRGYVGHLEEAVQGGNLFSPARDELQRQVALGVGIDDVANRLPDAGKKLEIWRAINTTTWQATDNLTVKNIVSYSELRNDVRSAYFADYFPLGATYTYFNRRTNTFPTVPTGQYQGQIVPFARIQSAPGTDIASQSTFTEELRLQGTSFASRLNWQVGAYYEKSSPLGFAGTFGNNSIPCVGAVEALQCTDVLAILTGAPQGTVGNLELNLVKTSFRNVGVYAQGSYKLTDWLDVTGGARYTWDRTTSRFNRYNVRFPAPNSPRVSCIDPIAAPAGLTFASALDAIGCEASAQVKTSAPTWTLSLEARPITDMLAFIKYSRGYRQGSTNSNSLPGFKTYDAEKVDVYEAGLRYSGPVLAGRAFANITGFYNNFKNQQVQAGAFVFNAATNAIIFNAGKSRMYGVEVEAGLEPVKGLRLNANYGYLNTKLVSLTFPGTLTPAGTPGYPLPFAGYDLSGTLAGPFVFPTSTPGTALPLSPKHQVVLNGEYALPVAKSLGTIAFGATYSYTAKQIFSVSNFPRGQFGERNLVNLNLSWRGIGGGPVDAALFATNVFNDRFAIVVNDQTSSGFVSRVYNEPRIYGLRVRYAFGE